MVELTGEVRHSWGHNYSLMTTIFVWCGLVIVSSLYITLPMVSIFSHIFEVDPSLAGWSSSAFFTLSYAVGFLLFGPLSDRFGRKRIMFTGLLAMSMITPILGTADNVSFLITLRAVQGLIASSFAPSVLAYVVEMFPLEGRVTAVGFVSTGFLIAGIAGQPSAAWLVRTLVGLMYSTFLASSMSCRLLYWACLFQMEQWLGKMWE